MQVEGQHDFSLLKLMATGARVSNAYVTCLPEGDSPAKVGLIPYGILEFHDIRIKGLPVNDGDAFH